MNDVQLDRDELMIWRILARLESLALRKYENVAPDLAVAEKKDVVSQLLNATPDGESLDHTLIGPPMSQLLEAAASPSLDDTLLVQGFVLERLGQVIYKILGEHPGVSQTTRTLAMLGGSACTTVIGRATGLIRQAVGEGEVLFERFCGSADSVLRRLDGLGSGVEKLFGERFGLTFSELLGEFTAELLPACVDLGMNRRKLVCHLAGVFMGG